jgi:site-specific recombinase XerD
MRNNLANPKEPFSDTSDLLEAWQEQLLSDHATSTARRYLSAIHRFLAWYEEEEHRPLDVRELTPIALVGYRRALQAGAGTSTVNTHVSALRSWCSWLGERGLVTENPAARLKLVSRQPSLAPKALEAGEVNALLRAAAGSRHPLRNTAIVQVMLQTGLRIGECVALSWEDIQFGEKKGWVTIRGGKGDKARQVPLNASAREALAAYAAPLLGAEPSLRAVATAWPASNGNGEMTPLWHSQKGGRMTASAMARMISELVRDCAARKLVPADTSAHTLRHTFATHYLEANPGDMVGLASVLGHNSLNTTRIYVQPTADTLAERIETIGLNAYD